MRSFSSVTVGVSNLDDALSLWVDGFGLEVNDQTLGPDANLANLWNIAPQDIKRQALVRTPGQSFGMLHFVEFENPDPPVRSNAEVFDSCPKNLDLYVRDMPEQVRSLKSLGYRFRSEGFSELTTPEGDLVREIQMSAKDDLNVVLLQMLDEDMGFSQSDFRGIGPLVTTVSNADEECRFYQSVLGLDVLNKNLLSGPILEKMVGLPPRAKLKYIVLGNASMNLGRIEIVGYEGTNGSDLFARAKPKALGILHITYELEELEPLISRLALERIPHKAHGDVHTLAANGDTISFASPAGFRIEAVKRNGVQN